MNVAKTEVPHETPFIPGATALISETWFPSTVLVCLLTQAQRFLLFAPEQVGLPCALSRGTPPPSPPAAPSASRKRVRSCRAPRACPAALHALALIHTPADIPAAPARHRHGDARGEPPPRPPDGHARRGRPGERGSLQAELPGPLLLFCLLQPMVSLSCRPRVSCLD